MADDLGTHLARAGLATRQQVTEAQAEASRENLNLVQALLRQGVPEHGLTGYFVSRGYGPVQSREELEQVDPAIARRLPGRVARRFGAIPVGNSPAGIVVAMMDPSNTEASRAVERELGQTVLPTVAPVSALRSALQRHYPDTQADDASPPASEQEPVELVQGRPRRETIPDASLDSETPSDEEPVVPLTRPKAQPARTGATGPSPPDRWEGLESSSPPAEPPDPWVSAPAGTDTHPAVPHEGPAGPPPDARPSLEAIDAAQDRDEVVRKACEAGAEVSRTTVFLALRRGVLTGWDGAGQQASPEAIRNLWIPTQSESVFRDVIGRGGPYDGPHGSTAVDRLFASAVGSRGQQLSVHPVLVGERLVGLLCADGVRYGEEGQARIARLAERVGAAFRRILAANKRRGD